MYPCTMHDTTLTKSEEEVTRHQHLCRVDINGVAPVRLKGAGAKEVARGSSNKKTLARK